MKTLISVTRRHIKAAFPALNGPYVLTTAIQSRLKRGCWANITGESVSFNSRSDMKSDTLPTHAAIFALTFDALAKHEMLGLTTIEPFSFHLNIPSDMLKPSLRRANA